MVHKETPISRGSVPESELDLPPRAYVSHSLKTRTRLSVPAKRKSEEFFTKIRKELSQLEGVSKIHTTPTTGSILVYHHADVEVDDIKRFCSDKDILVIEAKEPEPEFDIAQLGILGMFGLALMQVFRGRMLPPAYTLVRDALEIYELRKNAPAMLAKQEVAKKVAGKAAAPAETAA